MVPESKVGDVMPPILNRQGTADKRRQGTSLLYIAGEKTVAPALWGILREIAEAVFFFYFRRRGMRCFFAFSVSAGGMTAGMRGLMGKALQRSRSQLRIAWRSCTTGER